MTNAFTATVNSDEVVETGLVAATQTVAEVVKTRPVTAKVTGGAKASGATGMPGDIRHFLSHVVAWPGADEPGYINLHWTMLLDGKLIWAGKPCRSLDEFLRLTGWALALPTTRDIYYCLSLQAQARTRNGKTTAARHQKDALALKAIWLDVDVKLPPKGYASLAEAQDAIAALVKAIGLPPPSAQVGSGGGVHCYWISEKSMTPSEWQPYANGLKAAALKHGLRCDAGVTINSAQLLRVPGTWNHKSDSRRPVQLLSMDLNHD